MTLARFARLSFSSAQQQLVEPSKPFLGSLDSPLALPDFFNDTSPLGADRIQPSLFGGAVFHGPARPLCVRKWHLVAF